MRKHAAVLFLLLLPSLLWAGTSDTVRTTLESTDEFPAYRPSLGGPTSAGAYFRTPLSSVLSSVDKNSPQINVRAYASPAAAITAAPAGATVLFSSSATLSAPLAISKDLHIRGLPGVVLTAPAAVTGTTTSTSTTHLVDSGANFVTAGVTVGSLVVNGTAAELAHVVTVTATDLTLDRNVFTTGQSYSIRIPAFTFSGSGTNVDVEALRFSGFGAVVDGRGLAANATVRVADCTFTSCTVPLYLRALTYAADLGRIEFTGNSVTTAHYGVFVRNFGYPGLLAKGNRFKTITNSAVRTGNSIDDTANAAMKGTLVTLNVVDTVYNPNTTADVGEAHAFLLYGQYSVVEANYITNVDNGETTDGDAEAIYMVGSGGVVADNVIVNGGKKEGAITSKAGADKLIVRGNLIIEDRANADEHYGIFTTRDEVLIDGNTIIGMGASGRGIHTFNVVDPADLTIRGNELYDCGTGIQISSLVKSLVIDSNTLHDGSTGIILANGYNLTGNYVSIVNNKIFDHTSTAISYKDMRSATLDIRGNTVASTVGDTTPTLGISITGLRIESFTHGGETAVSGGVAAVGDYVKGASSGAYGTVSAVTATTLEVIGTTGTWTVTGERIDKTTTLNGSVASPGWYVTTAGSFTHAGVTAVAGGTATVGDYVKGAVSGAYGTVTAITATGLQISGSTGDWVAERVDKTSTLNGAVASPGWYVTISTAGLKVPAVALTTVEGNVVSGVKTSSSGNGILVGATTNALGRTLVRGNAVVGGQYGIKALGIVDHLDVTGNDFSGYGTGRMSNAATTPTKRISLAVAEGSTSLGDAGTVAHGLGVTPAVVEVSGSVANEIVTATADSTYITVSIKKRVDGTSGTTQAVSWRVIAQ